MKVLLMSIALSVVSVGLYGLASARTGGPDTDARGETWTNDRGTQGVQAATGGDAAGGAVSKDGGPSQQKGDY